MADHSGVAVSVHMPLETVAHCLIQLCFRQCVDPNPPGDPPFVVDGAAKPPFVDEVDRAEDDLQGTGCEPVPVRALEDYDGHEPSIPPSGRPS